MSNSHSDVFFEDNIKTNFSSNGLINSFTPPSYYLKFSYSKKPVEINYETSDGKYHYHKIVDSFFYLITFDFLFFFR
jgi:hypothetical protein